MPSARAARSTATASSTTCSLRSPCNFSPAATTAAVTAVIASAGTGNAGTGRRSVRRRGTAASRRTPVGSGSPRPTTRTRAKGPSAAAIRSTAALQPSAARAISTWCRATPQLTSSMCRSESSSESCLDASACRARTGPSITNRHGWVLWIDGARAATRAAAVRACVTLELVMKASLGRAWRRACCRPARSARSAPSSERTHTGAWPGSRSAAARLDPVRLDDFSACTPPLSPDEQFRRMSTAKVSPPPLCDSTADQHDHVVSVLGMSDRQRHHTAASPPGEPQAAQSRHHTSAQISGECPEDHLLWVGEIRGAP